MVDRTMYKRKRILNVGCGNDIYGTDFVDLYPLRRDVIKCDIEKERLPFKNNIFDEVYSSNLFEHLKNPNFTLKEMVRVLKHGGRIVIKTDNAGFWLYYNSKSKWKVHHGGYEKLGAHGKFDRHYALYTPHHIKNHLDLLGVKVIKISYNSDFQGLSLPIRLVNWILSKTRFNYMAFPRISVIGIKVTKS